VALAPLLLAVQGAPVSRAFLLGLITGFIYFTGTLYWITIVMSQYGGLSFVVAVLVNALLIAYLALFPAAFAMVTARLSVAMGPASLVAAPFAWVATELGRAYLFTGFPWVLLGYSQATVLPIAQFASVFGVWGLSAIQAGVSAALAYAAARAARRPVDAGRRWLIQTYAPIALTLIATIVLGAWGARRIGRGEWTGGGEPVKVGLIQGNVDQADKWDPTRAVTIFREYLNMTRRAIGEGAQVVLWPESSTPFYFEEDKPGGELVRAIARQTQVPILVGSDQIARGEPTRYYNSAFLVRADGSDGGVYRKMHLVPFGEYVPLKQLFFFAGRLVEAVSDFSPGESLVLLPVRDRYMSTSICYEIVYPDLVRQAVSAGSQLLTTITNDAWFGRTSAPYQHFAQASMRAIENGRYLVRAANTGVSGIVDPYGRVVAATRIFEPAVVVGDARFVDGRTIYSRIGDLFAYASGVFTLTALLFVRRRVK
jgi:apolipoprotein N-acyltransferase